MSQDPAAALEQLRHALDRAFAAATPPEERHAAERWLSQQSLLAGAGAARALSLEAVRGDERLLWFFISSLERAVARQYWWASAAEKAALLAVSTAKRFLCRFSFPHYCRCGCVA